MESGVYNLNVESVAFLEYFTVFVMFLWLFCRGGDDGGLPSRHFTQPVLGLYTATKEEKDK